MLIERSDAQRLRLCTGLHAAFEPQRLRNSVRNTVIGLLLRNAMGAAPLTPLLIPARLVRLAAGAWLAYRTFTALRAGFKR